MPKKNLLALTGGGTAGHVMPHVAMLPHLRKAGLDAFYIGSAGIERELMAATGIEFEEIAAGKLRRYFSVQNFLDVFKVGWGCVQAFAILARRRPQVVFSKGGFVSVPVAVAAWLLRIPVISHESDLTPGLANKIIAPFASRILYCFPQTARFVPKEISEQVGIPIRDELFQGSRAKGLSLCGFPADTKLPVLLVMGGSLGAQRLNDALLKILPSLVARFHVVHLTGKGKGIPFEHPHYKSFEYVSDELKDLLAAADLVVSRAGANSIFEFLALGKPMLLVPLEVGSRGDQIDNAKCFVENGWARMLRESTMDDAALSRAIDDLWRDHATIREAQRGSEASMATDKILAVIKTLT